MCVHWGRKKSSLEYFLSVPTISLSKGYPVKGFSYEQSLLERGLVSSDQYVIWGYFACFFHVRFGVHSLKLINDFLLASACAGLGPKKIIWLFPQFSQICLRVH